MTISINKEILRIENLVTGYGKKQILAGVNFQIAAGEIVALIGHNGAGKSTLLKAIFGMIRIWSGSVFYRGRQINEPSPRSWLSNGVVYVPQGNRVFPDLTVYENLEIGSVASRHGSFSKKAIEHALKPFPALLDKFDQRAGSLSGGEKQLLAIARALALSPDLLLVDEPSLGLSPPLVNAALQHLREISRKNGVTILIVEQKVREVLKIADRVLVLRTGQVSFSGSPHDLADEAKLKAVYL